MLQQAHREQSTDAALRLSELQEERAAHEAAIAAIDQEIRSVKAEIQACEASFHQDELSMDFLAESDVFTPEASRILGKSGVGLRKLWQCREFTRATIKKSVLHHLRAENHASPGFCSTSIMHQLDRVLSAHDLAYLPPKAH